METKQESKPSKVKVNQSSTVAVRVKRETRRRLFAELAKVNKKSFGKKVRLDALVSRALDLLSERDLVEIQQHSLSNADRLEIAYREHVKKNGPITKDAFLGIMLASTHVDKSSTVSDGENRENSAI